MDGLISESITVTVAFSGKNAREAVRETSDLMTAHFVDVDFVEQHPDFPTISHATPEEMHMVGFLTKQDMRHEAEENGWEAVVGSYAFNRAVNALFRAGKQSPDLLRRSLELKRQRLGPIIATAVHRLAFVDLANMEPAWRANRYGLHPYNKSTALIIALAAEKSY